MAVSIRLSRGGSKKRPYYRIVVADSRSPRDGSFIEKIGTYNPLLAKDSDQRVKLDGDRASYWLGVGAQPTDRVARFLDAMGIRERAARNNPNKAKPGEKAVERAEEREGKAAAAAEAAAAPAPEPEVEAPAADGNEETEAVVAEAVETATDEPTPEAEQVAEAVAEETPAAEEAPVEEAAAEAPAEEVAPEEAPAAETATEDATNEGESASAPAEGADEATEEEAKA